MIIALEGAAFAAPSPEQLFYQGETSFEKGDYASAVAKWNESYALSKEPELLFNIAQALRKDGRCADAVATYRRFVRLAPDSDNRPLADEFVRELTPKCDAPRDLVEHDKETHPAGLKIAGLAVVGAGAVSVATGLYFGHRASSLGEEVSNACAPPTGCDWAVYGRKDAEGRRAETKQYVFAGIGVAAIIGGGVMYYLASQEQRPAPFAITPRSDGAVIAWSGSW
jgi:tetratricopeptide (TPR) repeat protein